MVYPALLPLMHIPRLPVYDWTDAPTGRFKWTRPFRWKTKSGFGPCAITFQTQSNSVLCPEVTGSKLGLHIGSLGFLYHSSQVTGTTWNQATTNFFNIIWKPLFVNRCIMSCYTSWTASLNELQGYLSSSQQRWWRFTSPGIWCRLSRWAVFSVLEELADFIVGVSRHVYTGPPGWSTRLNQRNWIQRLNDAVYTVPQRWTRQSVSKWRQMNLCVKVLLWYVTI